MIVVAIIGILAAVAIPGFMQYIKNSKTSEAKTNLNAIGKGALSYFEAEHIAPNGLSGFSKQYPYAPNVVHVGVAASSDTVGVKSAPDASETVPTTGTASAAGTPAQVWSDLNFNITGAIYYYYSFKSSGYTPAAGEAAAKYEKSYFQANATASLSDNADSIFCLNGFSNGKISPIIDGSGGLGASLTPACAANTVNVPTADP